MQDPCASFTDVRFTSLIPATFVSRPNRFLLWADIGSRRVTVASRDPGRLEGILFPGARLLLAPAANPGRHIGVYADFGRQGDFWVCLVPALASQIVHFAAARKGMSGLKGAKVIRREVVSGRSRIDFLHAISGTTAAGGGESGGLRRRPSRAVPRLSHRARHPTRRRAHRRSTARPSGGADLRRAPRGRGLASRRGPRSIPISPARCATRIGAACACSRTPAASPRRSAR